MKQHFALLSIFNTKLLLTLLALHTTTIPVGSSATASQLTPLPAAAASGDNSRPRQSSSLDHQDGGSGGPPSSSKNIISGSLLPRLPPCCLDEERGSLALQVG